MSKQSSTWYSPRVGRDVTTVRWGEVGRPVLFFPTAAGDAEECERFHLVSALGPQLEAGLIKLYSVDSVPGMVWLKEDNSTKQGGLIQERFCEFVMQEVVPAIRADCGDETVEIVACGASIGAFNALSMICRHPEVFSHAICMSGTYDVMKFLEGPITPELVRTSPMLFLPRMEEGPWLDRLRERFVLLTHGGGRWEDPAQSWRAADALGERGIPNRVDEWEAKWDHDWPAWRNMLPTYLEELLSPQT
jgi:esterase/lipase superfamily enzyme